MKKALLIAILLITTLFSAQTAKQIIDKNIDRLPIQFLKRPNGTMFLTIHFFYR